MKCVHVCVYLNAGRHECAHSSVDMWKSEANLGYLSLSLPTLFFKAKSLTEPRSCCWGQAKEPQDMNIAVPLALWLQVTPLCSVPMRVLGSKFKSLWHV